MVYKRRMSNDEPNVDIHKIRFSSRQPKLLITTIMALNAIYLRTLLIVSVNSWTVVEPSKPNT